MTFPAEYIKPEAFLSQFLTDDGTVGGSGVMTVDGSTTSKEFFIEPPSNQVYELKTLSLNVINSTAGISPIGYMDLSALANGIAVYVKRGKDIVKDLTGGKNIRITGDWEEIFDLKILSDKTNGPSQVVGRVSLGGALWLQKDEKFIVNIQDNLSGLVFHEMAVSGRIYEV